MPELSREDYRLFAARVAGQARLRSIMLVEFDGQVDLESGAPGVAMPEAVIEEEQAFGRHEDQLAYRVEYRVNIVEAEHSVARLRAVFIAAYAVDDGFDAEDQEYVAYAESTVGFALYPYLREFVQSMTARLSLPPVTLDVLRVALPSPGGGSADDGDDASRD